MNPFTKTLGSALDTLPSLLKAHFGMSEGDRVFEGRMDRIWRKGGMAGFLAFPFLWLGSRFELLFTDTGQDIPFRLENRLRRDAQGIPRMDWIREFQFPGGKLRRFSAVMTFVEGRGIVDDLGRTGTLQVELHPEIEGEALLVRSGRQWAIFCGLRIPLPALLAGEARVREWVVEGCTFGIRVEIWNPLLGCIFGYEGWFKEVDRG